MNKNIKKTIEVANKLHGKGLIYFKNNSNNAIQPNYQFLAMLIEELELLVQAEKYEMISSDKQMIAYSLADKNCSNNKVFFNLGIHFTSKLIMEYVDLEESVLIGENYVFIEKFDKLKELYHNAWGQINENKFLNIIF